MKPGRRQFLKVTASTAVSALLRARRAFPYYTTPGAPVRGKAWPGLLKYATALRGVGPSGIPVAAPDGVTATGATHYTMAIAEFRDQLHPALGPTTLWGYSSAVTLGETAFAQRHLGGIIVAQRDTPIQVTFRNTLPSAHVIPVDDSTGQLGGFHDAAAGFGGSGHNAASVHLHGGFVPWVSDGGPMAYFTPRGDVGPSFASEFMTMLNPSLAPGEAEYYYPNAQSARLLWYHDHAHDITRLSAYAGAASAYIIRDAFEGELRNLGLPDFVENAGPELPLIVQDKVFVGPDIAQGDPTWADVTDAKSQTVGSLWYPHVYERNRWLFTGNLQMPDPSVVPEMFGDTMLVNGTVFPVATVEPRRYRLRLLNACQARFLNLQLYVADSRPDGITYNHRGLPLNTPGPEFLVIGAEGGFLPHPVWVSTQPFDSDAIESGGATMLMAPAERLDVIVDFAAYAGKSLVLYTDAPAPFPEGSSLTDFSAASGSRPGYGPDTRILMKFNVSGSPVVEAPLALTTASDLTAGLDPFLVPPGVAVQNGVLHLPPGVPVRQLTLNESYDSSGRLLQLVGSNTFNMLTGNFGRQYVDAPTETPLSGTVEVWQIANLTGDTHPIHFHLVNVQVLGRQPFSVSKYTGTPVYTEPARNPDPTELGWKETVKMHPEEVTTVIMRFDLPQLPFTVPASPRTGGHEYVWHCHILEHEEHDMMRPLVVV